MELKDRIAEALRIAKKSPTQAAAETGLSDSAISQLLSGKTKALRASTAVKLETCTGVRTTWLVSGEGPQLTPAAAVIDNIATRLEQAGSEEPRGIRVSLLANHASMGDGAELQDGDVMIGTITLAPSFVNDQLRISQCDGLRFIHAHGDSMSPTFNSGDVLLVDTAITDVKIDGVYVLRAYDRLFVKRVRQRIDGQFEISSDNPTYRTVDVLDGRHHVDVLGRVVWAWTGNKL